MKRILKALLKVVLGLVLLLVVGAGGILGYVYGFRPLKRPPQTFTADTKPETIRRGRYLAESVYQCAWCHSEVDVKASGAPIVAGGEFGGRDWRPDMPDMPDIIQILSPNITPDPSAGIGGGTEGQIIRARREGIDKDDKPLFDFMPYSTYRGHMSDADAIAIVAYLK